MNRDRKLFVRSLQRRFFLRFHMTLILLAAFAAGLVTTKILLEAGVDVLWQRYLVAVTVAYLVFLATIRLWLWYIDRVEEDAVPDAAEDAAEAAVDLGLDFDLFEGIGCLAIVIAIGIVFFAAIYLIWAAPMILAEAAFEALLASALIRRTRQIDAPGWVGSVVRRTIGPFAFVLIVSMGIGWAAQRACPETTKIVHAVRCWLS